MSEAVAGTGEVMDELTQFYRDYYEDQLAELAQKYPKGKRSIEIDWMDLYRFHSDFADDFKKVPEGTRNSPSFLRILHDGLYQTDLPVSVDLESEQYADAHVRVKLPENERIGIGDIRGRHTGSYVAIQGQIERVTQQTEYMSVGAFACKHCGTQYKVPQPRDEIIEPDRCNDSGCSGKPSWELLPDESKMVDLRTMKIKQPPEDASGNGKSIVVYLEDDLAFVEGERSLAGMAGERVTVHGVLKRDMSSARGRNTKPMFGSYIDAHALEFENSIGQDIDMSEYIDDIREHSNADDTLERLIESFAPTVTGGDRMYHIKRAAVLYLFGGYRKQLDDGTTYRGDLHMLMVGDPATGKSSILNFIERVSPRVERLSGTDSTGVGLTASATQDDAVDGKWVLKPGMLPRASGGHAIVDELDKMDEGADNLHEALEEQRIHVAKAGMKAKLKTETGLIAAANPSSGRFDGYGDLMDEIDVDPALFSRFDIIHTLRDKPDETKDEAVAAAALSGWQEAGSEGDGEDGKTGFDVPVDADTMQAWVAHAKQLKPEMSAGARQEFTEFYTEERNKERDGDVVPITARALLAGARLAEAHARINLRDRVEMRDAKVAINVIRAMMGDIYRDGTEINADRANGVAFNVPDKDDTPSTQHERVNAVKDILRDNDGLSINQIRALADEKGMKPDKAEHVVEKLKREGEVYEPSSGEVRLA